MITYEKSIENRLMSLLGEKPKTMEFVEEIKETGDLLFFGGAVRDLCIDRYSNQMPRDFDIAINFRDKNRFEHLINNYNYRKNRFGGYKVTISNVEFDVWDLKNTWAFRNNYLYPSEENLSRSVYLNIDGIVYNFNKNRLYDEVFKSSILRCQLDITLQQNPQIELNLLRALVFRSKYNLGLSNRLKDVFKVFLSTHEEKLIDNLYNIQRSHYKHDSFTKDDLRREVLSII